MRSSTGIVYRDEGEGFPIVWIHAFPLSADLFSPQVAISRVRHVIPDLRGFGETPAGAGGASLDDHANDVIALMDELRIDRAAIAGVSMGGYIAFRIASRFPERVAALLLIDTRAEGDSPDAREKRAAARQKVEAEGTAGLVDEMFPKMLTEQTRRNPQDERVRAVLRMMTRATPEGVAQALRALAERPDSIDMLPSIVVPVLIVVGSDDALTPPADARRMSEAIPGAQLVVISNAAHLSNLEQPEQFNTAVERFLEERLLEVQAS